ncbi:Bug family tripartite tricarboxylate transporter substrate binding protein [Advenella mimigardefordensis]|uniref:Putative Bug-like extracytoplasmic solute binding receptor, TTT family n=1 Tax=Advenella mimigardefordensis (strain DSM 17166 / LMG 22922 / DPN7) TaxID=1247726 RepID=W0PFB8_ADVMD|nr:tripartite tricarboxylate transporter substrate binding protein [Advenella mimigardefordensis]AHG65381.1 putative Bug-like extracytoplasmic solute binding receptor, TTT family [Advenella mimigardefordensis DPN7]
MKGNHLGRTDVGEVLRILALLMPIAIISPAVATTMDVYPSRQITIIVPNPPGSATDTLARIAAEGMAKEWGKPVIVDNKPGAQGVIGVQAMKKAAPDGYTLIVSFSGINSSNPWLIKDLPYHYLNDFTHIAPMVRAASLLLVNKDSPYLTTADLIEAAKTDANRVTYGYGQATSQVMGGAFIQNAKLPKLTDIPYKGQPQALTDLVGKQYDFIFADLSVSMPFVESGRLRALAISTKERSSIAPDVPALEEQGLTNFDMAAWVGISGPAGIPRDIVEKLNAQITKDFKKPEVQAKIRQLGFTPIEANVDEFKQFVQRENKIWGDAIQASGIAPR